MFRSKSPLLKSILLVLLHSLSFGVIANSLDNLDSVKLALTAETKFINSDKNLPELITLFDPLYRELGDYGIIKALEGDSQVTIKLRQETWINIDGYIFNLISGTVTSDKGETLGSLRHFSVSLPQTDQSAHLIKISKKMILDLARMSHFKIANKLKQPTSQSSASAIANTDKIRYPENLLDNSTLKVKYRPQLPSVIRLEESRHIFREPIALDLVVDPTGVPVTASLRKGTLENNKRLIESTMIYSLSWRFEPFLLKGNPTWVRYGFWLVLHP